MTNMLFHGPDGIITVGPTGAGFTMRLAEFLAEEPDYVLPVGQIWQRYEDGAAPSHVLSDGSTQSQGILPWPEGDGYIANVSTYQANVEAARAAAIVPPPTAEQRVDAMLDSPQTAALIGAIAPRLVGTPSAATLRAEIRALIIADM